MPPESVLTLVAPEEPAAKPLWRPPAAKVYSPRSPAWWHYANPLGMVLNLWRHRALIRQFTWRDLRGRYQGAQAGMAWSLLTPMLMLCVYTFVFNFVLKARWGLSPNETALEFALTLFCGLCMFNVFAESAGRAPGLITSHANYVKKVVFPLEILPITTVASALVHALIAVVVVTVASAFLVRTPGWHLALFPLLLIPYVCLLLGLSWFLASLGTFVRDLGPVINVTTQFLIFATPVFYPLSAVPPAWQRVLGLNPLATYVENSRRFLLWDLPPTGWSLVLVCAGSFVVMQAGYIWFMKSKKAFADVV